MSVSTIAAANREREAPSASETWRERERTELSLRFLLEGTSTGHFVAPTPTVFCAFERLSASPQRGLFVIVRGESCEEIDI